jgi:hypothetical protein
LTAGKRADRIKASIPPARQNKNSMKYFRRLLRSELIIVWLAELNEGTGLEPDPSLAFEPPDICCAGESIMMETQRGQRRREPKWKARAQGGCLGPENVYFEGT